MIFKYAQKASRNANPKQVEPLIVLEQLEPRILLSSDSLLSIVPGPDQDTTLDDMPQMAQCAVLLDANEYAKEQTSNELAPSDTPNPDPCPPVLTLFVDDDNEGDEDETADDLSIDDIAPAQTSDDIAVLSDNLSRDIDNEMVATETVETEDLTTNGRAIPAQEGDMPTHSNDADSSIEFASSIEIRGPPAQTQAASGNETVFLDSTLEHGLQVENAYDRGVAVGVLPVNTCGIQYITDTLSSLRAVSAIHIISHGAPGRVSLGSTELTAASVENYADQLHNWALSLTADAKILIYGCSVARSVQGQALVDRIAELTGVNVAASSNPTGNAGLGGDWLLEVGDVDITQYMKPHVLDAFAGVLAYPPDPTADIPWWGGTNGVSDIQMAFNSARAVENTQLATSIPALLMPSQPQWDTMSDGERALWLINAERTDRELHPLHGLETNVVEVAQAYAQFLLDDNTTGHTADGHDPWWRLDQKPAIRDNHDFLAIAENLAYFWTTAGSIDLPIERSVYVWMYQDSGSNWGHRHAILWYPYNDNSGPPGQEGFLGIGRASGPHQGWPFAEIIVMNVFDPSASWLYQPQDRQLDFGDAPDSYGTLIESDGARHVIDSELFMGTAAPDADTDGFGDGTEDGPNAAIDDDTEGTTPDDEDGVVSFDTLTTSDTTYSVEVAVTNNTGSSATLIGWIDFDRDGSFQTDEGTTLSVADGTIDSSVALTWSDIGTAGPDITTGETFARFRLTTDIDISTSTPGGEALDGEVEDYSVSISNQAPTDIILSDSSIAENQTIGTSVGTFSTTDPDSGDTHTYSLVIGAGDTDNSSFQVVGNELQTNAVLDYETRSTCSVRIRVTDAGGLSYEEAFTISVADISGTWTIGPAAWGAASLTLTRDGNVLRVYEAGTTNDAVAPRGVEDTTEIAITARDSEDDTLTVDFSGGNPIPTGAVSYDGGTGGHDTLALTGGSFTTAAYNFTNNNAGSIDLDGSAITHTGLEPIRSTINAGNVTLDYGNMGQTITVTTFGSQTQASSTAGETVTFSNPIDSLIILAGGGDDTINMEGLGSGFAADLTIDGQGDSDTVNFQIHTTDTGNGDLNVAAETVNINQTLNTGSGSVSLTTDSVVVAAPVQGYGTLNIKPQTPDAAIGLGGGEGTLNLDDTELTNLLDGFSSITIGDTVNGAGTVDIETATFLDPVTVAGGPINDHSGIDITAPLITLKGNVSPGQSPGILKVGGDFVIAENGTLEIEFGGTTPGTDDNNHDQLDVSGTVTIESNVMLNVSSYEGYMPVSGDVLVIINNDGTDAISGTFLGLAEGAIIENFLNSGLDAVISYQGGTDHNDVVLTVQPIPIEIILDTGDPGTDSMGQWSSSNFGIFYGNPSLTSSQSGDSYHFTAPASGFVKISLWWTAHQDRSDAVAVEIYDGSSLIDAVVVDQQQRGGRWNSLGVYDFTNRAEVRVIAPGGALAVVDAAQFWRQTQTEQGIIDHTCTDLTKIPLSAIERAKSNLHIAYGATSHGSQLTRGMEELVDFINNGGLGFTYPQDTFAFNDGGSNGALDLRSSVKPPHTGLLPHPFIEYGAYDLGRPDRTTWATATRSYLNVNPEINVIIWAWCGQASTSTADIDIYLDLMEELIADYPNVQFVFMTGHLEATGIDGVLNRANEHIRNHVRQYGRILYDFADIESYDPDGQVNYMPLLADENCDYDSDGDGSLDRNWAVDWQNSHTEGVDWYQCISVHSQPLNANQKAYAAWWLWAMLAGWGEQVNLPGFRITETETGTSVDEAGSTDSFDVVLSTRPESTVVITIDNSDTSETTLDQVTLTFTPDSWNVPQTITVSGVDDSLVDGDVITHVSVSIDDVQSDDRFDGVLDQTISVTTTDDDTQPGFTVIESDGTTRVSESGTTDSFQVVLDAEPDSNVVIQVTGSGAREATVDQSSLTFTPANWHTPQTVTVTGQDDNWIDGDQTTLITLSIDDASSDNNFDDLSDQTVSVTTTDNDAAGLTITQTGNGTSVSESGTTDSFQVVLDAEPQTDVVINITSSDIGEVTVDPTSLTFSPGSWDTPQTVFVTGVDDSVLDNDQVTNVTLEIDEAGSDDAFDALADHIVPVTTADDDSVADEGLIAYWPLDEESGLTTQDATGNGHTGTLSGGVSFTSGVFNNGVEFDGNDGTVTFGNIDYQFSDSLTVALWTRFSGTDRYYQAIIHKAPYCYPFSIRRYDTRLRLAIRTDNGMGYLLSTARLPLDTWHHVATTYQDGSLSLYIDGQLDSELAVSGSLLESPENTTMGKNEAASSNIPFNGGLDEVYIYNRALNASEIQSLMSGPAIETVGFTVTESSGSTSVTEAGSTDTFDVALTAQPESDVVLTITSGDIGEITVDQASLTFAPANWDTPQTVTVTGQDDSLVDGDQTTVITLSVDDAQSDDQFDAVLDQTISVTTTDDDIPPGLTVTESDGTTQVSESGTTDSFQVLLDIQPSTDVVINITSGDTGEATVDLSSLTFTPADWDIPQTVTVSGQDDGLIDGDQTTVITLSVDDAQSDDQFDAVLDQTISVTTTDDDAAGNNFSDDSSCIAVWNFEPGALTTDSKGSNTLTNEGGQLDESVYKVDEASAEFRRSYTDQMRLEESGMDSGFPGKSGESNKSFTVCFWVRVTMVGIHQDIFSKVRTDGNRQYIFSIDAGNYMRLNVSANGSNYNLLAHSGTIQANRWYHAGVTYDNRDYSARIRIWDDTAQAVLGTDATGELGDMHTGDAFFRLSWDSTLFCVSGNLDEVVVFNRVLSASEIDHIRRGTFGTGS